MRAQKIEIISWTPGHVLMDMSWPRAKESVETVEPSFLWMLAQPPMALTGLVLRKNDFGKTWDGGRYSSFPLKTRIQVAVSLRGTWGVPTRVVDAPP